MRRTPALVLGWREWVYFPDVELDVPVKAKLDTGAATSSLHAYRLRRFDVDGSPWVSFEIHPNQHDARDAVRVEVPVVEERRVRSSNGRTEQRPVISTGIRIGDETWPIELTLTRRDAMGFRMLLGRQALRGRAVVDVSRSYLAGRPDRQPGTRTARPR